MGSEALRWDCFSGLLEEKSGADGRMWLEKYLKYTGFEATQNWV